MLFWRPDRKEENKCVKTDVIEGGKGKNPRTQPLRPTAIRAFFEQQQDGVQHDVHYGGKVYVRIAVTGLQRAKFYHAMSSG